MKIFIIEKNMDKIHLGFLIVAGKCTTLRWSVSGGFRGSPLMYLTSLEEVQAKVKEFVDNYNHHRLSKALGWRPPVERYLGKQVKDYGFRNFWGLEDLQVIYSVLKKSDDRIKIVNEELSAVQEVVKAYRQAA